MNLLLIEDDAKIARLIQQGLESEGFRVQALTEGKEALARTRFDPDLVVLDLMLPGQDGLTTLREMKTARQDLPVLILSAKHAPEDRVQGLKEGADDYLVKPFSFPELVLRIQNLIKRKGGGTQDHPSNILRYADLTLDLIQRKAFRGTEKIELQTKEFDLLACFLRNPEQILSKTLLLKEIWGYGFDPQTNVVDVLVCRLRNKIDRGFDLRLIHTIRGLGYVCRKA